MFWNKQKPIAPSYVSKKVSYTFTDFLYGSWRFTINLMGLTVEVLLVPALLILMAFYFSGNLTLQ